jgi:hypothetical protein
VEFFEERDVTSVEDFVKIANSKNEAGGQALLRWLEKEIIRSSNALVATNPNDAGAVAQLQARTASFSALRQLILADPAKYEEKKNA